MPRSGRRFAPVTLATLLAVTSCTAPDRTADLVPTRLLLAQGSSALDAPAAQLAPGSAEGGRIDLASVDSLIVHVERVEVLPESLLALCFPPRGDSAHGFRPMHPDSGGGPPPPMPMGCGQGHDGPMGPGMGMGHGGGRFGFPPIPGDSLRPDSGWGHHASQWYTLDVEGDGRLDLVHLPTESAGGLTLASGDLPAGDYGAARLFVTAATIWFNSAITTDSGVTLQPGTGYAVELPRMAERMGIATGAGFAIPEGGGTVSLVFDAAATIAGAHVTSDGRVVLRPVIRPRPHSR
ncbi:MAG: hypothetical protein A2085_07290 [Gemmatimonadetes bacterium GWC2_71_10]|nr:MAG: hypothetical protein A2085_07290 [Gemmatimonadetes bacterium GWC2_71_10]